MEAREKSKGLFFISIKKIVFVILLISINLKSNAQAGQGCVVSDIFFGTRIYVSYTGDRTFITNYPIYEDVFSVACANGATNQIKKLGTGGTQNCAIGSVFVYQTGKIYNYTTFTCPLDDYLPLLFVPIALVGVWRIKMANKKRQSFSSKLKY
ncbi:hypothetical protein D0C36_08850 [Mucilaginibacter conchicola]|uniref:Uncharacterized protein n=1 Tax=Mucilaginibacter conchicola TaxID=2303333 RepID=A0A372P1I9_9SPHI|nr:hypothetical protein [Mucilaginibacter conchicola]RFZ95607.1 hypothetical protein D0C36_08850 [Mucilaginibacter conchicola]